MPSSPQNGLPSLLPGFFFFHSTYYYLISSYIFTIFVYGVTPPLGCKFHEGWVSCLEKVVEMLRTPAFGASHCTLPLHQGFNPLLPVSYPGLSLRHRVQLLEEEFKNA